MLRRHLPSNVSLFAFEAAARNLSFTRAASELNVTQPAISAAVAKLERFLATRLFVRAGSQLELTGAGQRLYVAVGGGFQQIAGALDEIRGRANEKRQISLSVSSAMTAHWFVPRLPEFQDRFPDVELRFSLIAGEPRGPFDELDLAVRLDSMLEGDVDAVPFCDERVYAVCSPSYLAAHGCLADGGDHTHIALSVPRITWSEFLDHMGIPPLVETRSLVFSDYALVIHAAASGQGLAMGWLSVVSRLLATGLIARAHPHPMATGRRYCLAIPRRKAERAITREVRDWIVAQMQADVAAIETLPGPA